MNEVVTTDSQSVTVAAHLPYGQVWISHLRTSGNGGCTAVNGVHAIGCHVVRQTAGTTDTRDNCYVLGSYANLGHSLMK